MSDSEYYSAEEFDYASSISMNDICTDNIDFKGLAIASDQLSELVEIQPLKSIYSTACGSGSLSNVEELTRVIENEEEERVPYFVLDMADSYPLNIKTNIKSVRMQLQLLGYSFDKTKAVDVNIVDLDVANIQDLKGVVLGLSSNTSAEFALECLGKGIDFCITKPAGIMDVALCLLKCEAQ